MIEHVFDQEELGKGGSEENQIIYMNGKKIRNLGRIG
jgi:hypothetical protein